MIIDSKLFNDAVKYALTDRNELSNSQRGRLEADIDTESIRLYICPFNGVYVEKAIGYYFYYLNPIAGKIKRQFMSEL